MASEVGSGQVAVFPVFKGFRKAVTTEVDGAVAEGVRGFKNGFSGVGSDAGKTTGSGFKKAFGTSARDLSSDALKTIQKDVASASKTLSAARLKEQDAAGKVRVAETQLAEARAKGTDGSSRVVAAEERLAAAHRKVDAAQSVVKSSTDTLTSAQSRLAVATSLAESASTSAGGGFSRLFSSLGSGFRGAVGFAGSLTMAVGNGLVNAAAAAGRALVSAAKVGVGAFTGLVALVAGLSIKGGISRLLNIEDAQAKLKGLGNSTQTVAEIMNDALASVKGTFFTLDDAATVAASAVAAGIKPGQNLTRYLKLTADAATIAGTSFSEMGSIINKTTTSGKVYTDTLNQLADRGVPIFTWLQKAYGVSAEKLSKMVEDGKVDSATFQRVIEQNIGGAALSAGNTTRGAFANMKAAMSRTGAALMTTILPKFQGFFTKVGEFFDSITPRAADFGAKLNKPIDSFLNGALRVLKALGDISKMDGGFSFKNIRTQFEGAFPGLHGVFDVLAALKPILPAVADAFKKVAPSLEKLIPKLADLAIKVLPVLIALIPLATKVLGGMADVLSNFQLPTLDFLTNGKMWENFWNFGDPSSNGKLSDQMQSGIFGPIIAQLGSFAADWDKGWDSLFGSIGADFASFGISFAAGWNQLGVGIATGWNSFWGSIGNSFGSFGASLSAGWNNLGRDISASWNNFWGGLAGSFASFGSTFATGWNQLGASIASTVQGIAIKAGTWLYDSGRAIIEGLLDGIGSMFSKIGKSMGKIMDFIKSFFPHSPAERGPFSGSGWTSVKQAGVAIGDQLGSGLDAAKPSFNARLDALMQVPGMQRAATSADVASSVRRTPIYVQNPFTGEYLLAAVDDRARRVVTVADSAAEQRTIGGLRNA